MKVSVYNNQGEQAGTIELSDVVFNLPWNPDAVHQVVEAQATNRRRGTADARQRDEVRGGGRKPWRQKGTGRARHGSIRSPIWKGGGVSHGPTTDKKYSKKINKKAAQKALCMVLSAKVRDHELIIVEELAFPEAKTKHAANLFSKLVKYEALNRIRRGSGVLVTLAKADPQSRRALRNLPFATIDEARNVNAYELLQHRYVMIPKDALTLFGREAR